ncbi:hypothetical protein MTP99_013821 [Tenebrio molitor]|jgi:hypothetical protein|nr:hypothetical protein MTP99_013821 [Tenebrio molitor]
MVPEGALSKPSLNSDGEDTVSTTSSEEDQSYDGTVVLRDDNTPELPSFGNVSVMNSSDIHFGNKTFYQGPVTIKQFLYANGKTLQDKADSEIVIDAATIPESGLDNPTFDTDFPAAKANGTSKPEPQESSSGIVKGEDRGSGSLTLIDVPVCSSGTCSVLLMRLLQF